jgi:cellulose synthase (UDP-forming)
MLQILSLKNPLWMKGLSWKQRVCYLNSCLFWFFGLARLVFFISPLLYLFFGVRVYNASEWQVLGYAVPHIFGTIMVTDFLYGRVRHPFFSELYEAVQSMYLVPVIFRRCQSLAPVQGHQKSLETVPGPLAVPSTLFLSSRE